MNVKYQNLGIRSIRNGAGGSVLIGFILCTMLKIIKTMMDLDYDLCWVKNSLKHILVNVCILTLLLIWKAGEERPLAISLSSDTGLMWMAWNTQAIKSILWLLWYSLTLQLFQDYLSDYFNHPEPRNTSLMNTNVCLFGCQMFIPQVFM